MNAFVTLTAISGLLLLPMIALRLDLRVAPRHLAWSALAAGVGSLVLAEALAIVCMLGWFGMALSGASLGHEVAMHFSASVVAVGLPVWVAHVAMRIHRQRRALRAEAWLGSHRTEGHVDFVSVPCAEPLAFVVPGHHPQVVISDGTRETLDDRQLSIVLEHESSHLSNHHAWFAFVSSVLAPVRWIPGIGEAIRRLPVWVERWVDDETARTPQERAMLQSTLLAFADMEISPAALGMATAATVEERLEALRSPAVATSPVARVFLVGAPAMWAVLGLAAVAAHVC